jgi:raffinose/stachyose/melibiose transport system substrate-binding protein
VINQSVSAFEKSHPGDTITVNYIENQSYKQKIQLAMGAGNAPTIFWTWGGGPLKQFIDAGDVASLGNSAYASNFLPSSLGAVTFDGKLYECRSRAPSRSTSSTTRPSSASST